eukprot:2835814-Karenia_brevis.AAC.1
MELVPPSSLSFSLLILLIEDAHGARHRRPPRGLGVLGVAGAFIGGMRSCSGRGVAYRHMHMKTDI